MEIIFQSFDLRERCQSQELAEQLLSKSGAKALRGVLADMRAATTVSEFTAVREAVNDGEVLTVALSDSEFIRFRQSHLHAPKNGDCTDWDKVYRVRILSIGGGDA